MLNVHFNLSKCYDYLFKAFLKGWIVLIILNPLLCTEAHAQHNPPPSHRITVKGTQFFLDDKPFAYTGVSFFNAIYNPTFNASSDARIGWMKKFQSHGINVLRVWCQWDSQRGFVDTSKECTMYEGDGTLRSKPLATLKAILTDADRLGICLEVVLFSHESYEDKRRVDDPGDERAVTAISRELLPFRNATFQIWNEHSDAQVLKLVSVIKVIDPLRLVTNSPGYANLIDNETENVVLDYLTPHTTRKGKHWETAPQEIEVLLKKYRKPVVDDEPARNGTKMFGGPESETSPLDHIVHILNVWHVGAYATYHHDMFQTGYGTPPISPSGIPDPDFNPYHQTVFNFLARREHFWSTDESQFPRVTTQPTTVPSNKGK